MSRMKHTAIAMAVVVLLMVSPTSKAHSTGIPVIDTANLVQSIVQALAWINSSSKCSNRFFKPTSKFTRSWARATWGVS